MSNKHYGIPYMGSKEKILHLIDYIFQRESDKEYFIDPFCGGFSVSAYALENYKFKVLANDLNEYVIDLYREMLFNNSREIGKVWFDWVSRERFMDVRDNPAKYPKWYVGYVLTILSFGNKQASYLFGKDIEESKRQLHQALVFGDWHEDLYWLKELMPELPKEYSPHKRLKFMNIYKKGIKNPEQLERLERLERLQQLERLESMDWHDFIQSIPDEILKNAFIYCDPPYENTAKYQKNSMDYNMFWNWFREFPYPVYVSSYSSPDDIKPINLANKKVLMKSNNKKRNIAKENIYFNGKGDYNPTMYDLLFN